MSLISFLISTTGHNPQHLQKLLGDIAKQTYNTVEAVVVLQTLDEAIRREVLHSVNSIIDTQVHLMVSHTIGLSKSRNIAMSNAKGDILLLCDDDCRYPADAAEHIAEAMLEQPDWDVISFQMAEPGTHTLHKSYPSHPRKHTLRALMHVSSVEIALRKHIAKDGKLFDERIGLGTPYITGGENVMLVDLYRRGLTLGYYPRVIVLHPLESSGHGSCDLDQLLLSKGVMFRRMFGLFAYPLASQFFFRRLFPGKALCFTPKQGKYLFRGLRNKL